MQTTGTINGTLFAQMVKMGAANLRSHAQAVNNLNVFPIPDGDTGSNMLLTIMGGADVVGNGTDSIGETARRISDGMLLSARGNSGVILSQIFEGIADGLDGVDEADNTACINAFKEGVRHSYNAVMEPTEGTMLTVMRCATEYVSGKATKDPEKLFGELLSESKRVLEKTPDMLPVLKKAGVVDSGGAGLVYIIEGMLGAMTGETVGAEDVQFETTEQTLDLNLFTEDSVL